MKSIAISEHGHKEVKTLCKTLGKNMGEFVEQSAGYFKKTGIDPGKSDNESPHKVVKELERRIGQVIAYIKTHEQDKLNPLLEHLIILSRQLEDSIQKSPKEESFIKVMQRVSEIEEEEQKHHVEQLKAQHKYYKEQIEYLEKSHKQINADTFKKMDEMAEAINNLRAIIETKISK